MATEKRLIDAEQLKTDMYLIATVSDNENIFIDAIIDEIDNADEVDAVEVVRCGKCKWYDPDSEYCQFWHGVRHPGHYCGEGDVKDNG